MDHVSPQREHDGADARGRDGLLKPGARRLAFLILALGCTALFGALGIWQVQRRAWKLDLIERVEARVHAAPMAMPGASAWGRINERDDAYRRVRASGVFLHDRETLVQAVTEQGAGFWVVTPLRTAQGIVLINRGFVPVERRDPATRAAGQVPGPVAVTGLMRMNEPKGAFLRSNAPAANRWYSRDVPAIAAARGLDTVAPFFLDADAAPNPGGLPVGGLTVVRFPNSHLVYAITWFALAGLTAFAAFRLLRQRTSR